MEISINQNDLDQAKLLLVGLKSGFPKAFSRALNRTTTGVRTDMVGVVRARYNYKATTLRGRISIEKASYQKLSAAVRSSGGEVHLTEIVGTRQTKKGVTVDVKRETGRQLIPSGFIQAVKSGKVIALIRSKEGGTRVGRYPVEALYASHPEQVYNTDQNWAKIETMAGVRLNENFAHEVDALLKGYSS